MTSDDKDALRGHKPRQPCDEMFDEGLAAFNKGMPQDANPYPAISVEGRRWAEGWEAASDGAWDAWKSGQ